MPGHEAANVASQGQALVRLQALRDVGGAQADPIGLAHLEALARQVQAHYGPLQARLQQRLELALDRFEQACDQALATPVAAVTEGLAVPSSAVQQLAELNRLLQEAGARAPVADGEEPVSAPLRSAAGRPEMKSVARFREGWARLRAETRVNQALGRKPEHAGPLNSHALLLRSLDLMRGLSPDYLRRFVTHVDALLWLDGVDLKAAPPKGKTKTKAVSSRPRSKR